MELNLLEKEYIRMYLSGESLNEYDILNSKESFFRSVLQSYGSWHNFEKSVGILQRHIREREKFELYWIFKRREEKFGPESLRHKNIESKFKKKISDNFRTVTYLTNDLIKNMNNEALLYEVHAEILCGETLETIKKNEVMINRIEKNYDGLKGFKEEYKKMFLIEIPEKTISKDMDEELDYELLSTVFSDIQTLLDVGFITEKRLLEIQLELKEKEDEEESFSS